jgi:predicted dehydrogenase
MLKEGPVTTQTSTRTVRIGFIGAGGIARERHLPGLQKIDGVELVAVANRSRESGEKVAREYGFKTVKEDWRELLAMPDIDAVFIAAPPYLHKEATVAAIKAGKHVFCQARMARNLAEAREMYDAAKQSDRVTMLCPPPHAMHADFFVKRLIKEGFIGQLRDLHVYGMMNPYADPDAPLHWRQDSQISGLNTLFLGMYAEVINRWFGGHKRLTAMVKVHTPRRKRPDSGEEVEVKIADSLGIVTEMENGALSVWHLTGASHHPQPHRFELHGSEGTIIVNMQTPAVVNLLGGRKGESLASMEIPADERREWLAEADFIEAIRTGKPVSPDFDEGIKYMEFTEAVYRSADTGRTLEIPLKD